MLVARTTQDVVCQFIIKTYPKTYWYLITHTLVIFASKLRISAHYPGAVTNSQHNCNTYLKFRTFHAFKHTMLAIRQCNKQVSRPSFLDTQIDNFTLRCHIFARINEFFLLYSEVCNIFHSICAPFSKIWIKRLFPSKEEQYGKADVWAAPWSVNQPRVLFSDNLNRVPSPAEGHSFLPRSLPLHATAPVKTV